MNSSGACPAEVVRRALAQVATDRADDLDTLDPCADVWRELDLDSLDHVTVMEVISDATGTEIAEREYPRLLSLAQLRAHVERALR